MSNKKYKKMKKTLKVIGIIVLCILACGVLVFEVKAFDEYVESKVSEVKTAIQAPPVGVTIQANGGYTASTFIIELNATPDEFKDYFENVLANDTINQIIISAQRTSNDSRKMKWSIVYNDFKNNN